jgi:hypothetical protein
MSALPIHVYLINAQRWFSSLIHLRRPSHTWRELETRRHESWTAAQAIPAISAKVLERLLPAVTCLLPVCEPIVVALMIGSIMLTGRTSRGLKSDKCDGTQPEKDAA